MTAVPGAGAPLEELWTLAHGRDVFAYRADGCFTRDIAELLAGARDWHPLD